MKALGVGVIGSGIRGRHGHEAFLAHHPAVFVRAFSHYPDCSAVLREGHDEAYDRAQAAKYGADFYGEDFEAVLAREDIGLISLMVEPGQVADYVERCAAAGKHVYLDKPMAGTVADGERIVAAVARHDVKLLIAFSERYTPPFRAAAQRLLSGELGCLLAITVTFCPGGPLEGFTGSTAYRESFGGGELANFGCYCADYVNWLAGAAPQTVFAQADTFFYEDYRPAGMDDLAQCLVRYENGCVATLVAGRPRGTSTAPWFTADLTAERGSLRATAYSNSLDVCTNGYRRVPWGDNGLRQMAGEFVEAILQDEPSPIPAEAGLASLRVIQGAYEAVRTGLPVQLPAD